SGSEDDTVKIWDARTGKVSLTLTGHSDNVRGVAFRPDGQRVADLPEHLVFQGHRGGKKANIGECFALQLLARAQRPRVPYPHRLIATGGGEALAVWTEGHTRDSAGVPHESERLLAAVQVPDLHGLVRTAAGQALAVRAERDAGDRVAVSLQGET